MNLSILKNLDVFPLDVRSQKRHDGHTIDDKHRHHVVPGPRIISRRTPGTLTPRNILQGISRLFPSTTSRITGGVLQNHRQVGDQKRLKRIVRTIRLLERDVYRLTYNGLHSARSGSRLLLSSPTLARSDRAPRGLRR